MKIHTLINLIFTILFTIATTIFFTLAIVNGFRIVAIISIGFFFIVPTLVTIISTVKDIINN